jgi:UDP-glucose 4-epimerase
VPEIDPRNPLLLGVSVLVTGATGNVGGHFVDTLLDRGARVSILTRDASRALARWPNADVAVRVADLTDPFSLGAALDGIELIYHLASYSPPPGEPDIYEASAHWPVTAEGTASLVQAALAAGVRRFVYLSSVKAMGDGAGASGRPADESTPAAPESLYGRAKLAAEKAVIEAGAGGRMHVCVLRLPMVYGLDGQGNIARMVEAVARGRFPPWPKVTNRRSAIHLADVVAAALRVGTDRGAAGKTYLVTDGESYSTRWLYEQACLALGRPIPNWTVPVWLLRSAAQLGSMLQRTTGRNIPLTNDSLSKLLGDAWYCSNAIHDELGFSARHRLDCEIRRLAKGFRNSDGS